MTDFKPYKAQTFDFNRVIRVWRSVIEDITGMKPYPPGAVEKVNGYPYLIYNIANIQHEQSGNSRNWEMMRMSINFTCYSTFYADPFQVIDDICTLLFDQRYIKTLHDQGISVLSTQRTGTASEDFFGADDVYQSGVLVGIRLIRQYTSVHNEITHLNKLGGKINGTN